MLKEIATLCALLFVMWLAVTVIRACTDPHAYENAHMRMLQEAYKDAGEKWP
jgi:hypothetical protein